MSLAYMVGDGIWRGSDPDIDIPEREVQEYYVNHSCDGNAWYEGEDKLIAKR